MYLFVAPGAGAAQCLEQRSDWSSRRQPRSAASKGAWKGASDLLPQQSLGVVAATELPGATAGEAMTYCRNRASVLP